MSTAFLVLDVTAGGIERIGVGADELLAAIASGAAAARSIGMPVIYSRLAMRPGGPESSPSGVLHSELVSGKHAGDDPSTQIHPAVAPQADDIVIVKKRISPFAGSDLEMILRAKGVTTLVTTGIVTSFIGLAAFYQATDLDFRLTFLRDAWGDTDTDLQELCFTKIFPRLARVTTVDEWARSATVEV